MSSHPPERPFTSLSGLDPDDEADLVDRLTNHRAALNRLETLVTLYHLGQENLLKEMRATQVRHGEMLARLIVQIDPSAGPDPASSPVSTTASTR